MNVKLINLSAIIFVMSNFSALVIPRIPRQSINNAAPMKEVGGEEARICSERKEELEY